MLYTLQKPSVPGHVTVEPTAHVGLETAPILIKVSIHHEPDELGPLLAPVDIEANEIVGAVMPVQTLVPLLCKTMLMVGREERPTADEFAVQEPLAVILTEPYVLLDAGAAAETLRRRIK